MKTLERTTTPTNDEAPAPRRLKIHEGALVPGGKKAVHYEEDGSMTLVDVPGPTNNATFEDITKNSLADVDKKGDEIIADDETRAHFAEILSDETLDADEDSTPEQKEKRSLRKSAVRKLGNFSMLLSTAPTLAYAAAIDKLGAIKARSDEHRAAHAAQDGDSRRTRFNKFINRNKTMLAAGTLATLAAGVSVGLRYKGIELGSDTTMTTHDTLIQHGEILNTADTQILVGGRGMPDGDAMRPIANSLGLRGDKTIGIDYPAQIKTWATPGDTHTLDQSSAISAQKVYDAYRANKNGTVEIVGYSEGTQGVQDALDRIARENGGTLPDNISVKIIASPNTEGSGVFNDPKAKMLKPLFDANGATMDRPMPKGKNVQVIAMNTDFWANAGNRPPSTMISQAIGLAGDGHRAPAAGMRYTDRIVDGTTYRTYYHDGTQNAALRVAEQHGFKVTKKADQFANALAPTGELGQEDVRVNAGDVLRTGGAAAEEALTANGVAPEQAQAVKNVIENVPSQPVQTLFDAAQDIPNQIAAAPQAQTVVEQAAPVIEQVAPVITQAIEQAPPVVQQATKQAAPILGQFGIKLP